MAVQTACDRCAQGVTDADQPERGYFGNDHLYGRCQCECHEEEPADGGAA